LTTLGAKPIEVRARAEAACLDGLPKRPCRRARIGRRLEHDELVLADVITDEGRGREHRAEIGILRGGDRGRHADEDGIGRLDARPGLMDDREPGAQRGSKRSVMSSIGERPAPMADTRGSEMSMPSTSRPASAKAMASGRPTYPRPMTATRVSEVIEGA
jgi:hypothetical protein